ncbi:MAG: hypothetical protein ACREM9_07305 [Gemmatimonadales bacterium]
MALGSLEAIATRAGPVTDPDGYTLLLNGVDVGRLGIEDTVLLRNLPKAAYSVGLDDLATRCDVGGGNPRGVRVEPDRTTRVIFLVKCD